MQNLSRARLDAQFLNAIYCNVCRYRNNNLCGFPMTRSCDTGRLLSEGINPPSAAAAPVHVGEFS